MDDSGGASADGGAVETGAPEIDTAWVADDVESVPGFSLNMSHPRGVYAAPFELSLSATPADVRLRWTSDGSDPLGVGGVDYDSPLTISTTTTLRVVAAVGETRLSDETRTYFFPDAVAGQVAPSWAPDTWWASDDTGPYLADYEMDPDVTESASYQAVPAAELFSSLPVVSLTVAPDDLFGTEGIHDNPTERGSDWERGASVEWLGFGSDDGGGQRSGLRIHGGSGRRPDRSSKKSFRPVFTSDWGPGKLEADLFEDGGVASFDTLILRARYNRCWCNWQGSQRSRSIYIRERFGADTHAEMGHLAPRARPVHLLLNGMYWGLYILQERPDSSFHNQHVGGGRDGWDVLNSGEATDGDRVAWDEMMALAAVDLSDPDAYAALGAMLDLPAFADYFLLNAYFGNVDWPEKNWYSARARVDGALWRFLMWDFELTMSNTTDDVFTAADADTPGSLFQSLMASPEFRLLFADRVQANLYADGPLTVDANLARWQALSATVETAVLAESARWGDHWRDSRGAEDGELYTVDEHWAAEQERMVGFYLPTRHERFQEQLLSYGLYPSVAPPSVDAWSGEVAAGTTVTLGGVGALWCTSDGSDPRAVGGDVASGAIPCPSSVVVDADTSLDARAVVGDVWSAKVSRRWTLP